MGAIRIALVVARAANGVIGRDGALPWRLASDMAHFKSITMGKPILMGRKTWDSLKRALPGRPNIVLTRDHGFRASGGWTFADLPAALAAGRAMAQARGADELCVIGGGRLYADTLPLADRLYLTDVDAHPEGDALFPAFDETAFEETERRPFPQGPKDDHAATLRVLDRRP